MHLDATRKYHSSKDSTQQNFALREEIRIKYTYLLCKAEQPMNEVYKTILNLTTNISRFVNMWKATNLIMH